MADLEMDELDLECKKPTPRGEYLCVLRRVGGRTPLRRGRGGEYRFGLWLISMLFLVLVLVLHFLLRTPTPLRQQASSRPANSLSGRVKPHG